MLFSTYTPLPPNAVGFSLTTQYYTPELVVLVVFES